VKRDKKCHLLAKSSDDRIIYQTITSADAGWRYLNFEARTMKTGQKWTGKTGDNECLFVLLGGNFSAVTSAGAWKTNNGRKNVFRGMPHALYLPSHTEFEISPAGDFVDLACGWCAAERKYPARLISPLRCR